MHKINISMYLVDAFTEVPFKGNPAAVCILHEELPDELLKAIAAEMNLSETAFVYLPTDCKSIENMKIKLRWFSPECEMPLCGHATLAASKVIFEELGFEKEVIIYNTIGGLLPVTKTEQGMVMEFPLDEVVTTKVPEELLQAVGIRCFKEAFIGRNTSKLVIVVDSPDKVLAIKPDYTSMKNFDAAGHNIKGLGVTALGNTPYDFTSRYFNPWAGVNEDSVTGSVHTVLARYWSERLDRDCLRAFQASKRQGEIAIKIKKGNRVELIGDAFIVFKGELHISQ